MNYHGIESDSMLNGSGLRVCLWCSGCEHHCDSCQNPQTWDISSGIKFDEEAMQEIYGKLSFDYISGLTLTGGDPLHENNLETVYEICKAVKSRLPDKTIWIYTGCRLEDIYFDSGHKNIMRRKIIELCDVMVDGKFEKDKFDINYPWAGSTNQRVIDIKRTIGRKHIVLWETK